MPADITPPQIEVTVQQVADRFFPTLGSSEKNARSDFNRFKTAKQLARYCGMSPCNASSGNKTADAGLIDGCNKLLRMMIVQAAHRLIRTTERWRNLAQSLKHRGKPACVIVGAVGNRWLRNLHHAMKNPCEHKEAATMK